MNTGKQPFAVFDIDGTLFRSGLYREVVYQLIKNHKLPSRVLQAFAPYEIRWKQRSHGNAFSEFEAAMANAFDSALPKLKISDFETAAKQVIDAHSDNVYRYTRDLARQLKNDGYFLLAISGSQLELVEPFAKRYGFDAWAGQTYERDGQYFTGKAIKTHAQKELILKKMARRFNLTFSGSVGVGDSIGDASMLEAVERPIAFNPETQLLSVALQAGWRVVLERKNVIYHLEDRDGSYILAETN
ncbi:MAG: HAD family hydrolase [Candidatus Chaera renei]|uniref:HAD family hydrolase n=1 Tax=Candidatus Chaera renei TaxID=2506947 RepID=A0A4Q0AK64_9BACT|nr:MAG: HAD family hydrolase [Candidatus Chaera renei]